MKAGAGGGNDGGGTDGCIGTGTSRYITRGSGGYIIRVIKNVLICRTTMTTIVAIATYNTSNTIMSFIEQKGFSAFNKDAMANVDLNVVKDEVTKVADELVSDLVEEVNRKASTRCFGWVWTLQISRQIPAPAPAKLVASESKSRELVLQNKVESV